MADGSRRTRATARAGATSPTACIGHRAPHNRRTPALCPVTQTHPKKVQDNPGLTPCSGGTRGVRDKLVSGPLPSRIFWSSSSSVGSISSQPSGGGFLLRFTFGIAAGTGMGGEAPESPPVRSPERAPRIPQNSCKETGGRLRGPRGATGCGRCPLVPSGAPLVPSRYLPVRSRCPPGKPPVPSRYLLVPPQCPSGTSQYPPVPSRCSPSTSRYPPVPPGTPR